MKKYNVDIENNIIKNNNTGGNTPIKTDDMNNVRNGFSCNFLKIIDNCIPNQLFKSLILVIDELFELEDILVLTRSLIDVLSIKNNWFKNNSFVVAFNELEIDKKK